MHYRRLIPALVATALISIPGAANAATVSPDTDHEVCVVSDPKNSGVVEFWNTLENEIRDARLTELDEADPGIKTAIEQYTAKDPAAPSAAEIQERLDANSAGEGLAMLLPEETTDPALVDPETQEQFKTEYTYDEAQSTIDAISDDPAANVLSQLETAAETGPRISEIRAEEFAENTAEYNQIQSALRDDFQACVDQIDDARPIPLQYLILGGALGLALIALIAKAWSNARTSNKH